VTVANEITSAEARPLPAGRYHFTGAIRSEWIKLRTVRSTVWTLAALIVLTIGVGVLVTHADASNWAHLSQSDRLQFDPTNDSLAGLSLGQLAIGVLGILVITAEHGTGSIRATLSAIPNRPLVLGAKAAVFGVVALLVGEAVCVVSFLAGQAMVSGKAPPASFGQPGVARAVLLAGAFVALIALSPWGSAPSSDIPPGPSPSMPWWCSSCHWSSVPSRPRSARRWRSSSRSMSVGPWAPSIRWPMPCRRGPVWACSAGTRQCYWGSAAGCWHAETPDPAGLSDNRPGAPRGCLIAY